MRKVTHWMMLASTALFMTACGPMNRTKKGAAIGTVGGGAIGAVIGKAAGNTAMGAIVGATVGGVAGAVIGKQMDKQAKEIEKEVPGAKVERVGEGIVVEFSNKILFGFDQYELNPQSRNNLDELVIILNKYPDTDIEVQGHTDDTGAESYNQTLSEKRAKAVSDYIIGKGIAASRITTKGYGENNPKYPNDSEANRAQNRRVEFVITANEKMKADAEKAAAGN